MDPNSLKLLAGSYKAIEKNQLISSTFVSTTQSAVILPKPETVQENDVMLVVIGRSTSNFWPTLPSGWTTLTSLGNANLSSQVVIKIATASEPTSYTFSGINNGPASIITLFVFRNSGGFDTVGTLGPVVLSETADTAESITPTQSGKLLVFYIIRDNSTTLVNTPTGTSQLSTPLGTGLIRLFSYYATCSANTPTLDKTNTLTASIYSIGFQLALKD
jgi:hypothetical protein